MCNLARVGACGLLFGCWSAWRIVKRAQATSRRCLHDQAVFDVAVAAQQAQVDAYARLRASVPTIDLGQPE